MRVPLFFLAPQFCLEAYTQTAKHKVAQSVSNFFSRAACFAQHKTIALRAKLMGRICRASSYLEAKV